MMTNPKVTAMPTPKKRYSLRFWLIVIVGSALFVPGLISGYFYTEELRQRAQGLIVGNLQDRAELSADQLARRLHRLWVDVERLSRTVSLDDRNALRARLEQVTTVDARFTWLGVAFVNGDVFAAANGTLEGQNVSSRLWFRQGLLGPFAGDVHEAVMLAKVLPARIEPYRFVDFSAPVKDKDGKVIAVVGAHLDWTWIRDAMGSLQRPGVDALLISRDGNVLYGPPALEGQRLTNAVTLAAGQTGQVAKVQQWADGCDCVSVAVGNIRYADLPGFGWSLVVRQDAAQAFQAMRGLARQFWLTLGLGALAAILAISLVMVWLTAPIARLTEFAFALSKGEADAPPPDETAYREASVLSAALTRLQSQLAAIRRPDTGTAYPQPIANTRRA
jgi:HAMP domain-containing protein